MVFSHCFSLFVPGSFSGGDFFFADDHVGDGLGFVGWLDRLGGVALVALRDVGREDVSDGEADERLDEEHLREVGKGQVAADQAEPSAEEVDKVEPLIIRIVEGVGEQAHRGAHDADGGGDDGRLEDHRVVSTGVELAAGEAEGQGASHGDGEHEGTDRLDDNHEPYRKVGAEHVNAALAVDGLQDRGGAGGLHQGVAFDDIQAVENKRVDGDDNRDQRIHQMLNLIL